MAVPTKLVTLRDESQVPLATLNTVSVNLKEVAKHPIALLDLVQKCRDEEHRIGEYPKCDSAAILKKFHLIDANENIVSEDIKTIVLNAIEGPFVTMRLVSPLKNQVAKL